MAAHNLSAAPTLEIGLAVPTAKCCAWLMGVGCDIIGLHSSAHQPTSISIKGGDTRRLVKADPENLERTLMQDAPDAPANLRICYVSPKAQSPIG
jgi:hypothetical protein